MKNNYKYDYPNHKLIESLVYSIMNQKAFSSLGYVNRVFAYKRVFPNFS